MKKFTTLFLTGLIILLSLFTGCADKTKLDPENPVTLTMWHVYGEQADSPMNKLVEEFNRTTGKENGIVINVTLMSSTAQIGEKLLTAQKGEAAPWKCRTCFSAITTMLPSWGLIICSIGKQSLLRKSLTITSPNFWRTVW